MKYGVTGPPTTKRYAQPKYQLYNMMLQVTHTYPAGAYKKPLAFVIFQLNADVLTIKISLSLFVGSTSWIVETRCTYDQDKPKPFCRL